MPVVQVHVLRRARVGERTDWAGEGRVSSRLKGVEEELLELDFGFGTRRRCRSCLAPGGATGGSAGTRSLHRRSRPSPPWQARCWPPAFQLTVFILIRLPTPFPR